MSRISVLTLVRGRRRHLENLLRGLAWQTEAPAELVIAWMQDEVESGLPDPGCPVRAVHVAGDPMPLAAARNRAAAAAAGEVLIFLDVDCIPSPDLVETYGAAVGRVSGVHMGEVLYLPPGIPNGPLDLGNLDAAGERHPSKPAFPAEGAAPEPDHGQLWGLSFALKRSLWFRLGGMDEGFVGYGGEETDFAAKLAAVGIPLWRLGGTRVWHQHHPVSRPPLDRLDEIIANANRFRAKWGRWCMDYWLNQFAELGLIRLGGNTIELRRRPTCAELAACRRERHLRYS